MINQFFKDTKPGGQLLALGLIFVLFFILSAGVTVVSTLVGADVNTLGGLVISQLMVFGCTAVAFALLFYDRPLRHLGMKSTERMMIKILASCVILVCLIPMSDWLTRINDALHFPQGLAALEEKMRSMGENMEWVVRDILNREGFGDFLCNILVFALVPAVCEELLFRGALQQLFCRMLRNHHVAIWLTAAVFSLFHGEIFAFLPRFVLGAALGYLFYYGGSIWINSTAHFLNNALAIVLYYLSTKGLVDIQAADSLNAPWYLALGGLVLAVVVFVYVFVPQKNEKHESGEKVQAMDEML
ncbi:MAG: CPBP family intramembrane metalloprotease [Bacteroidales bacterium]|nr:CPBP family intramembrane metalloprotease [Bacteroidales bacterium]